jgi:hypothetical protein
MLSSILNNKVAIEVNIKELIESQTRSSTQRRRIGFIRDEEEE